MLADVGARSRLPDIGEQAGTSTDRNADTSPALGVDSQTVIRLDRLRKQRNRTEYAGDLIPESAVKECRFRAELLFATTRNGLKVITPDLL